MPGDLSYDLRPATAADAPAVASVQVRAWQVAYRGLIPAAYLDAMDVGRRAEGYDFDRRPTTVAVASGQVVGIMSCGRGRDEDRPGEGELYSVYVDPEFWRAGVGRALVAEARSRLRAMDFSQAYLWMLPGNERAQAFYRADGWVRDPITRRRGHGDLHLDERRYRRDLP